MMIKLLFTLLGVGYSVYASAQANLTLAYDAAGNQIQYRYCPGNCDGEALRALSDSLNRLSEPATVLASGGRFYLYPNPTVGELQLVFEDVERLPEQVYVTDVSGRAYPVAWRKDGTTRSADLSPLPTGIYFLRFKTEQEEVTKRIIRH